MRKTYTKSLKFKVALVAISSNKTIVDIASEYGVTPGLIHKWIRQLKEQGAAIFERSNKTKHNKDLETSRLYEQIGRLKVENEFLKKIAAS